MASKAKAKVKPADLIIPQAIKNNLSTLNFLRNFVAVVVGIAVGILGVNGWHGFVYHYASQLACAAAMFAKGCTNPSNYFATWTNLLFFGTFSSTQLLSYILFWMIFYNLCHVF